MPVGLERTDLPAELMRVPFVGRDAELGRLMRMLEETHRGTPGLVVIEGPAGIGKTALVHRFVATAGGVCVYANGAVGEEKVPLGLLHQLASLAPAGPSQALLSALADRERPADPPAAGAALRDLLGELQHAGAVVLVIDDVRWADHPSLHAIVFALRRLSGSRVLTLVLVRDLADPRVPDSLRRILTSDPVMRLGLSGLSTADVRALSGEFGSGPLSLRAAERLRAHTDGNPSHARALLQHLPAIAFETCDTPLPAPRSFAMSVLARFAACPTEVQAFVEAASVLGIRCSLHQAADLAQVADPLSSLEHAIRVGFLVEEPTTRVVRFPQSLIHAAIYQHLGPVRRLALHARAATLSPNPATRLRHRARAASGPDSKLANDLAKLGRDCATNADWAAAGEHLTAAARLTPARIDREQLSMEAVECQLLTGDVPDPVAVTNQLRTFLVSGWRSYVLARLALVAALIDEAHSLFQDAWGRCDPEAEAPLGARIAAQLAILYVLEGRGRDSIRWADRALRLVPTPIATDMLHSVALAGLGSSGQAEAALASLETLPAPAIATVAELDTLLGRGLLRYWTDDLAGAHQDLSGVLTASHDRSAAFRLAAADTLANVEYRLGLWDDATAHSELALSLAESANQTWLAPLCHATAAVIAAAQGRWEQATRHAETAQNTSGPPSLLPWAYSATAAAQVALIRRQPEAIIAALSPLRQLSHHAIAAEPSVVGWQDVLADALVAVGDHEQADAVLGPFEARAAQRCRRSAMAAAARARGNLEAARGNHDAAAAAFQAGLEHLKHVPMPFERARLQLAYGAFLRRAGKRRLAVEQLRAAHTALRRLHAHPDLERCDRELAGCGLTPARRGTNFNPVLTPQELAVAQLVADGLTNRQIARELVISVKTVEFHLGRLFTKLQVTSRVKVASWFRSR